MWSMEIWLSGVVALLVCWRTLKQLEASQFWTIRLRCASWQHLIILPVSAIAVAFVASAAVENRRVTENGLPLTLLIAVIGFALDCFGIPLWHARRYTRLRWKAWTGPSRTGIPSSLVHYIGDADDWKYLASLLPNVLRHPVDKHAVPQFFSRGIRSDPTALLQAMQEHEFHLRTYWRPSGNPNEGIFQPVIPGQSVSLLWGEHLGFERRCSRAIISVPRPLLLTWPLSKYDLDGKGICLAFGILGRNKGLEPHKLVCNLQSSDSFRAFEENSIFWPRPAKTLRGLYHREFGRAFSLIGPSYVTAATELALLLTDIDADTIEDWLGHCLEHQDLKLNNLAHQHGANHEDLDRMYAGHYAAMLVSLSLHKKGNSIRPEMLVYDALCSMNGKSKGDWTSSAEFEARRNAERQIFGDLGARLIAAII